MELQLIEKLRKNDI